MTLFRVEGSVSIEGVALAWVRTSISMIGFGFTIYNFFRALTQAAVKAGIKGILQLQAPRNLALTLIGFGTLILVIATIQHRTYLNRLGTKESRHIWSLAFITAIFIALIGVVAFASIYIRGGPF